MKIQPHSETLPIAVIEWTTVRIVTSMGINSDVL